MTPASAAISFSRSTSPSALWPCVMDQPLAIKKSRRAKKTSTKTQAARKLELRKGLQAPRPDAPPLKEVSHAEFQAAKREEKKNLKRAARVKKAGEKKPYSPGRRELPDLGQNQGRRDEVAEGCHLHESVQFLFFEGIRRWWAGALVLLLLLVLKKHIP